MSDLGHVLKAARLAKGFPAQRIADHLGVKAPAVYQWESGKTVPTTANLVEVAKLLEIDVLAAREGRMVAADDAGEAMEPLLEKPLTLPAPGEETPAPNVLGNRDVEVRGISVGGSGDETDFAFNGQIIDYAHRPVGIRHRKGVFMIHAVNDSMSPAIEPGDPIYVDTNRPPQPGDNVVIELISKIEGEAGKSYVKKLLRRSGSKVLLEQHNPKKEITFDGAQVKALLRVIPIRELLGQ